MILTEVELSIVLTMCSILIAALSIIFAILTFSRNRNKDNANNEARLVRIETDIQYIRLSVDRINDKIDDHEKRISNLERNL